MKRMLFFVLAMLVACVDEDQTVLSEETRPSLDAFARTPGPADVLARRCGSLDCHGHIARPLRIYGQNGLRLDPNDFPGGRPRTVDESRATYLSVIGLEPEQVGVLMIDKANGNERHKGGRIFADQSDPGYLCLASWLRGAVDVASCGP